jgi:hypothetical protein
MRIEEDVRPTDPRVGAQGGTIVPRIGSDRQSQGKVQREGLTVPRLCEEGYIDMDQDFSLTP